ncbi:fibronectin type 3 and ankyrin repeat domains 1 protein-like isoform X1 [Cherax quadricarinatus]
MMQLSAGYQLRQVKQRSKPTNKLKIKNHELCSSLFPGPEVRVGGSGHHWVRVDWGDPDGDLSSGDSPGSSQGGDPGHATPIDVTTPRAGEGVNDSYEDYLELAYAKEVQPDTYLQDEDGLDEGPMEEEMDRTEVFPERPTQVYTVQLLSPRTGWTTIYRGSGRSCVVEGLAPAQLTQVRVCLVQDQLTSPWSTLTIKTKSVPSSGQDLVEAVQEDNASLVRDVLTDLHKFSQMERIDHVVEVGHTALVAAVKGGSRDALAVLLERRAAVTVPTGGPHLTPLALAAWLGHLQLARRLRAAGALWNQVDRNGLTALHYGVAGHQLEVVKVALQEGANVRLPAGGYSVLSLAVAAAHRRATSARLSMEEVEEATKMVEALVEGGAEVNQRDAGGNTALHVALTLGLPHLARTLVSLGSEAHLVNGHGYTPSHLAYLSGHSLDKPTPRDQDRPPMGKLEALTHLVDDEELR